MQHVLFEPHGKLGTLFVWDLTTCHHRAVLCARDNRVPGATLQLTQAVELSITGQG